MQAEFNCITDIENKYNYKFTEIEKKCGIDIILDIFNNKLVFKYTYSSEILNLFGIYYFSIKDFKNMLHCVLIPISKNFDPAKINLAYYYFSIKEYFNAIHYLEDIANKGNRQAIMYILRTYKELSKDKPIRDRDQYFETMKKYCVIAIKAKYMESALFMANFCVEEKKYQQAKLYFTFTYNAKYTDGIRHFGHYFRDIEKNYDKMKQMYHKSVSLNDTIAIICLGKYYQEIEKNYDEMKKVYQKGIDLGDTLSMCNLAKYYQDIEKNYDQTERLYTQAANTGCVLASFNLALLYKSQNKETLMLKYYFICLKKQYSPAAFELSKYYKHTNRGELAKQCLIYNIKSKTPMSYILLGVYYEKVENNLSKMHKYFTKAFNLPDYKCPIDGTICNPKATVMNFIGEYYVEKVKDYAAGERCLLYAFQNKDTHTLFNLNVAYKLGSLYESHLHNYDLMKKYYDIAIKQDRDVNALNAILKYYVDVEPIPQAMWSYYDIGSTLKINNINGDIIKSYIQSKLVSAKKTEDCMICYQEKEIYYSNCEKHAMCVDCSVRLFRSPCPYCRKRPRED
jgi:hypothetical protein